MGYLWRQTAGKISCKPKRYGFSQYPSPNRICNKKCPYHIFCKLETMHITLGERIDEIRLILQRPFHLFTYLPKENQVMFILESENIDIVQRLSFTGVSIIQAIESAENYIEREKITGGIRTTETEIEEIGEEKNPEEKQE